MLATRNNGVSKQGLFQSSKLFISQPSMLVKMSFCDVVELQEEVFLVS
jgi:hypothetical protein